MALKIRLVRIFKAIIISRDLILPKSADPPNQLRPLRSVDP